MWTKAVTVDVCKECGTNIVPGERLLRTFEREPKEYRVISVKVTFCEGCGELFEESLELGQDDGES